MVYLPKNYEDLYPAEKKNKFNAKKETTGGKTFDSGREAKRYRELKLQQHCGVISDLNTQVWIQLLDDFKYQGKKIKGIRYKADFVYIKNGKEITEDSKGYRTKEYKLKKKMLLNRYPDINFLET